MVFQSGSWGKQAKGRSTTRKEYFKNYRKTHKVSYILPKHRTAENDRNTKLRIALIEFMGGACVQCGFSDFRALQIDHINGGGRNDRRLYGTRYWKIVKESIIKGEKKYQLLCANCNFIKRYTHNELQKRKEVNKKMNETRTAKLAELEAKAEKDEKEGQYLQALVALKTAEEALAAAEEAVKAHEAPVETPATETPAPASETPAEAQAEQPAPAEATPATPAEGEAPVAPEAPATAEAPATPAEGEVTAPAEATPAETPAETPATPAEAPADSTATATPTEG